MKHIYILLFSSFLLINCNPDKTILTLKYDRYTFYDTLRKENSAVQTFKYLRENEYELTIVSENNYKQTTIVKINRKGIYYKCHNELILSHGFNPNENTGSCLNAPPFLNRRVKFIRQKTYKIGNRQYQIYSYGESSGSESDIATYYLKGIGFICYYNIESKDYYFLSDVSDKKIDYTSLKQLKEKLISDKSFFQEYFLKVAKPRFPM